MADIVVGADGSPSAVSAARWAIEEAVVRGATLRLVSAFQTPAAWLGMGEALGASMTTQISDEDLEAYAVAAIDDTLAALDVPTSVTIIKDVRPGHPADVLTDASQGALMLVVGNRGHGDIGSVLLGSVGLHCVHHAACPVVVVPYERA